MTTTYKNVSTASQLSADIKAIDLASQADGGNGTQYRITLKNGLTLTESTDIAAINLTGADTLTINGESDTLSGADKYRGLFVYSGYVTIENLTIENAVAKGGAGGEVGGGGGAGLGGGLFVADNSTGGAARRTSPWMTSSSQAIPRSEERAAAATAPPPAPGAADWAARAAQEATRAAGAAAGSA